MTRFTPLAAGAALLLALGGPALAGGQHSHHTTMEHAAAQPSGDIIDGAVASPDHTTLVVAVKAAGLVDTLKGDGPFTVFAPTNAAFDALPDGTVATLLKPENKAALAKVLTYHVVAGDWDSQAVAAAIESGGGSATLTTVQGEPLTAMKDDDGHVVLKDAKGAVATITAYDLYQSNGVIHVVDTVMMPS